MRSQQGMKTSPVWKCHAMYRIGEGGRERLGISSSSLSMSDSGVVDVSSELGPVALASRTLCQGASEPVLVAGDLTRKGN